MLDRAPRRISPTRLGARRAWVALIALGAGACSIYSSELVDDAASNVGNGARSGGGSSSGAGTGGKSSATGGKATGNSTSTPEGGDDGTGEGGAGAAPTTDGGTGGTGTAGTATGGGGTAGATGGGGTGTAGGGTAGSGGGPVGNLDLIDDFEDKNISIEPNSGRSGVWYAFGDSTTGTLAPDPLVTTALTGVPEALTETLGVYGLHVTATGWSSTGSGLGFDFRAGKKVYDASKYVGFRFWAKGVTGKNTKHRVQISDVTTDAAGAKCKDTANATKCGNHFGAALKLTTAWTQYSFAFADLTQIDGWGNTAEAIDPKQVYGFQITAGISLDVDIWVDQFEFILAPTD